MSGLNDTNSMKSHFEYVSPLLIIIMFVVFMLNFYVIFNILINKNMRRIINMFLLAISFYGILVSIVNMPFEYSYLKQGYAWIFSVNLCIMWYILDFTICIGNLLNAIVIMFIRYLAIIRPHKTLSKKNQSCYYQYLTYFIMVNCF